jgi:hypothetical protein
MGPVFPELFSWRNLQMGPAAIFFGFFPAPSMLVFFTSSGRAPRPKSGSIVCTMPKRHAVSHWFRLLAIIFRVFCPPVTADGRCPSSEEQRMKNVQESLDKLRADAAELSLIGALAADPQKREHYARLADHLNVLASEIARAIATKASDSTQRG